MHQTTQHIEAFAGRSASYNLFVHLNTFFWKLTVLSGFDVHFWVQLFSTQKFCLTFVEIDIIQLLRK